MVRNDIIFKDYIRGCFIIRNVPYARYSEGIGFDGEETYISGDVMWRIGELIEEMYLSGNLEIHYYN